MSHELRGALSKFNCIVRNGAEWQQAIYTAKGKFINAAGNILDGVDEWKGMTQPELRAWMLETTKDEAYDDTKVPITKDEERRAEEANRK